LGDKVYHLGQVRGLGYNGRLIVKGNFTPKLELEVMDNTKRIIGRIARVFGPVESPYISIKLPKNHRPSLDIVGKEVYVGEKSK
jgi:rRNA processing protein Gar1